MKRIMAGEVLTVELLNKLDKAAYQFGGLEVDGEIVKKSAFSTRDKTVIIIYKKHIKGNIEAFEIKFGKTMNALHYQLKII